MKKDIIIMGGLILGAAVIVLWMMLLLPENLVERCLKIYPPDSLGLSDCEEQICKELNLTYSNTQRWSSRPVFYCSTQSGGDIEVIIPQSFDNSTCSQLFYQRWELVLCLYEAGYLNDQYEVKEG